MNDYFYVGLAEISGKPGPPLMCFSWYWESSTYSPTGGKFPERWKSANILWIWIWPLSEMMEGMIYTRGVWMQHSVSFWIACVLFVADFLNEKAEGS